MKLAFREKSGVALVAVLGFCTAILGFVGVMHFNMKTKTHTQKNHYENTKALWAATSGLQLALYKYRVLPSEYYYIQELEVKRRAMTITAVELILLRRAKDLWLRDLNSAVDDSVAAQTCAHLDTITGENTGTFGFEIESFDLVSNEGSGYIKDFLRVRAMGRYKSTKRILEDMVEISISK
jgi:hypothetical protein